jgi:hypothetical protein
MYIDLVGNDRGQHDCAHPYDCQEGRFHLIRNAVLKDTYGNKGKHEAKHDQPIGQRLWRKQDHCHG